jgi:very-short-patch-repair endonuclease
MSNDKNEESKTCKCCGYEGNKKEFVSQKHICKVCNYIDNHDDNNILNLLEEDYKKVLYLMLNGKLNYINDLCDILNITLDEAILLVKTIGTKNGYRNSYLIKCNCEQCGKKLNIRISKYEHAINHFCGKECIDKYKIGKHTIPPDEYNNCTCDWCGKEFHRNKAHIVNNENNLCSNKCRQEYFKNITVKTDKFIERNRKIALDNLKNGVFKKDSSIQLIVNDLLLKLGANYKTEYVFGKYSFDNYLEDSNIFIEVMGQYWHSDPRHYENISYDMQRKRIGKDKAKRSYAKNKGINILYLWEKDINENIELCKELVKIFINNSGILQDYNSFNYSVVNNNIKLNPIKIKPYIDYTSEEMKKVVDVSVKEKSDYYISFICDECGKEVTRLKSRYGDYDKHFCSVKCRNSNRTKYLKEKNNVSCTCDFCGEDINKKSYNYSRSKNHFCSLECSDKFKAKGKVIKICKHCRKEILLSHSHIDKNKSGVFFCSQECYKQDKHKNNTVKYKCDYCGKDCEIRKYEYEKYKTHFCSVKCSNTFKNKHIIKLSNIK